MKLRYDILSQQTFICWKSVIETLEKSTEKVGSMFKVNNKDTRKTSMTSFWRRYCYLWPYLKQVNVC